MDFSFIPRIDTGHSRLLASCRIALVMLLAAALPVTASDTAPIASGSGKTLSKINYKAESGDKTLDFHAHKLTALHFWAVWCVPCVAELPELDAMLDAYKDKGFAVVALSLDENMSKVTQFFAQHHIIHLSPTLDINMGAFKTTSIRGLPTTLFIDSNGKEIGRAEGPVDWKSTETAKFIESHLK